MSAHASAGHSSAHSSHSSGHASGHSGEHGFPEVESLTEHRPVVAAHATTAASGTPYADGTPQPHEALYAGLGMLGFLLVVVYLWKH